MATKWASLCNRFLNWRWKTRGRSARRNCWKNWPQQLRAAPRSPGGFDDALRQHDSAGAQAAFPGDRDIERRIKSYIRWNAMAMVVKANSTTNVGGHISTYASSATLYEVAFNHFLRGATENFPGDIVYFQGHAAPGMYARAFLEGRSMKSICKISGRNWPKAAGCRRIRIRI
jgi:uncharacterized protein YfaT (DUF1175 family)